MRWRIPYILLMGVVLAGIIHIAVILLIPQYSTRDAWAYLSGRTNSFAFTIFNDVSQLSGISEVDPFFSYGVCRFDLEVAPLRLEGKQTELFWSASVFDESGKVIYSLNDRTAIDKKLNLLIIDPVQALDIRGSEQAEIENSIIIEANIRLGFVVVRVLQPDDGWKAENENFLKAIKCSKFVAVAPQQIIEN